MPGTLTSLLDALGQTHDLVQARALLMWDERTKMPRRGGPARSKQLATLTKLVHERLASDEIGALLDRLDAELDGSGPETFEGALARMTRRDWEKARRVPAALKAEIAEAASIAEQAWERARPNSDFAAALPHLERMLSLKRAYIDCFDVEHPYDALLDDYEPGMTTAAVRPVLEELRAGTAALLERLEPRLDRIDDSVLRGDFPPARQDELARRILAKLPLEPDAWRVDETVHPFLLSVSISDQRITTRYSPGTVATGIWSVIHEAGHALYNNGIDLQLERTPLNRSASLGFDESQSRLWENWVGRGRPFAEQLLPELARAFPDRFGDVSADRLYRASNRVARSLIRVDADEVTYNLHIAMRFELELALFEGRVAPADLPEAWNELSESYLGIRPHDDASGVLQDVHWYDGAFGYFPTYSLGNVIAARLWELAREELPELDGQIAAGELEPLRAFMAKRVYRVGGRLFPSELLAEVTGGPLDPAPLLRHLERKFGALYELE